MSFVIRENSSDTDEYEEFLFFFFFSRFGWFWRVGLCSEILVVAMMIALRYKK